MHQANSSALFNNVPFCFGFRGGGVQIHNKKVGKGSTRVCKILAVYVLYVHKKSKS